jgi:hypothetical protein
MPMTLLETVTVGAGGANSIAFSAIPQEGHELVLLVSSRVSATNYSIGISFNSDSSTLYARQSMYGTGSDLGATNNAFQPLSLFGITSGGTNTANTFAIHQLNLKDYTQTKVKYMVSKSVSENNSTQAFQEISTGEYRGTSPITSLQLDPEGTAYFLQHSTASLYTIS